MNEYQSKNKRKAEAAGTGCAILLVGTLAIGWLVFCGWMIYWVVSWLTAK